MPTTPQVSWPWTGVLWPTFQTAEAIEKRPSGSDRKSTRLNSSHSQISYAVFCLKKKNSRQRVFYCRHQLTRVPLLTITETHQQQNRIDLYPTTSIRAKTSDCGGSYAVHSRDYIL